MDVYAPFPDAGPAPCPDAWADAWECTSRSTQRTRSFGRRIAALLPQNSIIGLVGTLGAGKTTFVQGLAQGWGVADLKQVTSPTYTLVNIYTGGRGPFVHIDLYRLTDADSAYALGLDETIGQPGGLVVVEWADQIPELLPPHTVWLRLIQTQATHRTLQGLGMHSPVDSVKKQ